MFYQNLNITEEYPPPQKKKKKKSVKMELDWSNGKEWVNLLHFYSCHIMKAKRKKETQHLSLKSEIKAYTCLFFHHDLSIILVGRISSNCCLSDSKAVLQS